MSTAASNTTQPKLKRRRFGKNSTEVNSQRDLIMQTEHTSLLNNNSINNNAETRAKKILRNLKPLISELLDVTIFGASLKVGLDVYLESWINDIESAGWRDFNQKTISTIGAYTALAGILAGYALRKKLINGNINSKLTYLSYKILQTGGAWGLHAYLLKLFLFSTTEICTDNYRSDRIGNFGNCTYQANHTLPLSTICCLEPNPQQPGNFIVSLNEPPFIAMAVLSQELITYAIDVFRYEFSQQSPARKAANLLRILASAVSYGIVKYAVKERLPLLYYTAIPIGVHHLLHWLTTLLPGVILLDGQNNNNQYRNGYSASLLAGFGGAALVQSLVYSMELYSFPYPAWRTALQYIVASGLSLTVAYQASISRDVKDFFKRLSVYFLPKPLLDRIHWLPDYLLEPVIINRQNLRLISIRALGIAASASVTFGLSDLLFHYLTEAVPYGDSAEILDSTEGKWLRFSFAIASYFIWAATAYGEPFNLEDANKINWPTFSKLATFGLMGYGLLLAIEYEDNPHQVISIILSVMLLTLMLGKPAFKLIKRLFDYCQTSVTAQQDHHPEYDQENSHIVELQGDLATATEQDDQFIAAEKGDSENLTEKQSSVTETASTSNEDSEQENNGEEESEGEEEPLKEIDDTQNNFSNRYHFYKPPKVPSNGGDSGVGLKYTPH